MLEDTRGAWGSLHPRPCTLAWASLTRAMTSMCMARASLCMRAPSKALRATRQRAPLQAGKVDAHNTVLSVAYAVLLLTKRARTWRNCAGVLGLIVHPVLQVRRGGLDLCTRRHTAHTA